MKPPGSATLLTALMLVSVGRPWSSPTPAAARDVVADIRTEALQRSRVMQWVAALTGAPRLTGSPSLDAAGAWAMRQLQDIGLTNVRLERWPFERRWSVRAATLEILEPEARRLSVVPQTWSPGTSGSITGPLRLVRLDNRRAFEREAGQLRGAFVLVPPGSVSVEVENRFQEFLRHEGAVATLERSVGSDAGVVYVRTGHTPEQDGRQLLVPALAVLPADFRRLERLVDKDPRVVLRADIGIVSEAGGPGVGFNVVADLVGSGHPEEIVLIGAHLDSIHVAQGATDNAAGCSAIIEAVRAIVAAGAQPTRTIRVALWGGEEQGRRGSKAYVQAHDGDRTVAYFNIDRGAGRIVGLTLEGNEAARGLVERWTFAMPGVNQVLSRTTAGSDQVSFRDAGIPSLTFLQDMDSYGTTHHSTGDVVGAIHEKALRQAAATVAVAAYLAATGERLPR